MLSRWKGMETHFHTAVQHEALPLDMLSRWKGMETQWRAEQVCRAKLALDMLSRWKGMETHTLIYGGYGLLGDFGYAFPLEGNGNNVFRRKDSQLTKHLWICFPVGREWKPIPSNLVSSSSVNFGYAFPLEGNGNKCNALT